MSQTPLKKTILVPFLALGIQSAVSAAIIPPDHGGDDAWLKPSKAVFEISSNADFDRVESAMNRSDAAEILIRITPGEYTLDSEFHINRSNVTLQGAKGVLLSLAHGTNTPVIAIGSQVEFPTGDLRVSNIVLRDIQINGNRKFQNSEYHRKLPWIRNNGIDVRVVSRLTVDRVTSSSNRSGGLVISWDCRDVVAKNSIFEDNHFDGVAYYDSAEVYTIDCIMRNNLGAGISLDNELVDTLFARCEIDSNRDVGVFARASERIAFYECSIANSGNWAFFLSHDEKNRGVFDIIIASCSVNDNNGGVRMGSVLESQSARTTVALSEFNNNAAHGRPDLSSAGSKIHEATDAWKPSDLDEKMAQRVSELTQGQIASSNKIEPEA